MDIYENSICLFKRAWYQKNLNQFKSDTKVTQFLQQQKICNR